MSQSNGSFIRGKKDILDFDSKVFVSFMNSLNYNARVAWKDGHTVSEVYNTNSGGVDFGNLIFKNNYK